MFANGPEDQNAITGRVMPKTQKWYLMPLYLTFSIIRYGSSISGTIQRKELHPPLHLVVVAIEKTTFGSLSSTVGQLIYIYIYIYYLLARDVVTPF